MLMGQPSFEVAPFPAGKKLIVSPVSVLLGQSREGTPGVVSSGNTSKTIYSQCVPVHSGNTGYKK